MPDARRKRIGRLRPMPMGRKREATSEARDLHAKDGAISALGDFRARECLAQLLDQRVVASLNAAKSLLRTESGF